MSKKQSLDNFTTEPEKVDKIPEGYTYLKTDSKGRKIHAQDVTLPKATNTSSQTSDPDAYFEQMKQKVAGGVDPNHLADQGYISKDYVSKLQPFYQQKLVYTEPINNSKKDAVNTNNGQFTPIQSFRSDIKLNPKRDASTPFDSYTIPDLNGQANKSTTVYIHPKTGQELDMNKYLKTGSLDQSINDNGRNLDYYKSLKRSEGTGGTYLPNSGIKNVINNPMQNSDSNTKAYSGGFKKGGLIPKFKRKGYDEGGEVGGFTGGEYEGNTGGFGSDNSFAETQGNNNEYANNYQSVPSGSNKGNDTYSNKFNLGKNMSVNSMAGTNNPTDPNYTSAIDYNNFANQKQQTNQVNQEADQAISQIPAFGAYYGAAKAGEGIGKSALPKDANGNVKGQTNQALNTLFTPTHEQIIDDFSAGNSTGTTMGVANLLTGGGAQNISALGAGIFGDKSSVGKFFTKAANAGVNENPELQKNTKYNPKTGLYETTNYSLNKKDDSFKVGGYVKKYAKGGIINGAGTSKSDSINADIKPHSFVVPYENVSKAKEIKKEVLGKNPNEAANLKQDGGTPVKLSNKEMLFTPEEVYELTKEGIDLDKLAPHAEKAMMKAKGGLIAMVNNYK